jgi:peptide/nickel transport system substrate-binding protein
MRLQSGTGLWTGMLALGVALLAASVFAGPGSPATKRSDAKKGGILRLNLSTTDIQSPDPAIDYEFYGGQLLVATCAKLMNYPDKPAPAGSQLVPEVAAGLPVISNGGRTYTFRVRKTFRFSDGSAVTPKSFQRAIERVLAKKTGSGGVSFALDIVGAEAYNQGKATRVSGITTTADTISIRLVKPAPDLIPRLGMNFFCAVPEKTPIDAEGLVVPMAGPYYISSRTPGKQVVLKRNPYYHGTRPSNVDEIVVTTQVAQQASYLDVQKGDSDYDLGGVPPQAHQELAKKYGVNKGRYWVHPGLAVSYYALNTQRAPFNDVTVRKAVNYAINRPAVTAQNGYLAGTPSEQFLPPGIRGYRDARIYPTGTPDYVKAKQLMAGRKLKATLYTSNDAGNSAAAVVVQQNLKLIGIDLEVRQFSFGVLITKTGVPTEPYDMVGIGWFADYADPQDFINVLLDGARITKDNNVNLAQFNDPTYNKRMNAASLLTGSARYRAYGNLDVAITRNAAPWAATNVANTREFVSSRVGCYVYQPAYGAMSLVTACLK